MTAAADPAGAAVLATYREPSQLVRDKVVDSLDRHCRAFLALSPFATLATAGPDGWPDVSPRGGDPGFARVLDERTVVLPDRQGNNRVDSLRNAVVIPADRKSGGEGKSVDLGGRRIIKKKDEKCVI